MRALLTKLLLQPMEASEDQRNAMDALGCDLAKACCHRKGCTQLSGEYFYRLGAHSQLTYRGHFDVPGAFARDIAKLETFVSEWYGKDLPMTHAQVGDSRPNKSNR